MWTSTSPKRGLTCGYGGGHCVSTCPHPVSTSGCGLVRRERRVLRGELLRDHGTLFPVPAREHPHQSGSSRARVLLPVADEVVPDAGLLLEVRRSLHSVTSLPTPPVLLGADRLKLVEARLPRDVRVSHEPVRQCPVLGRDMLRAPHEGERRGDLELSEHAVTIERPLLAADRHLSVLADHPDDLVVHSD